MFTYFADIKYHYLCTLFSTYKIPKRTIFVICWSFIVLCMLNSFNVIMLCEKNVYSKYNILNHKHFISYIIEYQTVWTDCVIFYTLINYILPNWRFYKFVFKINKIRICIIVMLFCTSHKQSIQNISNNKIFWVAATMLYLIKYDT